MVSARRRAKQIATLSANTGSKTHTIGIRPGFGFGTGDPREVVPIQRGVNAASFELDNSDAVHVLNRSPIIAFVALGILSVGVAHHGERGRIQ